MKQSRFSALLLRLSELWAEPITKISVGFTLAASILVVALACGFIPDPWNSHSRGPGWECEPLRGAQVCFKDVPPELQKPKKAN